MPLNNHNEPFVTTKVAAKMLNLSVATVQKMVETQMLVAWKTDGGHRRVLVSSINEYLNKKKNGNKTDTTVRIFIVEDDQVSALLYSKTFKTWNIPLEIEICESGVECVHLLSKKTPDLIITDLKMDKMDGFELIKFIKSRNEYKDIFVIVVTGLNDETLLKISSLNITILHKPIPFYEIKGFVNAIFNYKKIINSN